MILDEIAEYTKERVRALKAHKSLYAVRDEAEENISDILLSVTYSAVLPDCHAAGARRWTAAMKAASGRCVSRSTRATSESLMRGVLSMPVKHAVTIDASRAPVAAAYN